MKYLYTILFLCMPISLLANSNSNFTPYIGANIGMTIEDYTYETEIDETYYSATINAGARIGKNFGAELFFTHSSTNDLEYIYDFDAINHEIYYMAFGFDIYAYYNVSQYFDFFTSFGVANYKTYTKYTYINQLTETSEQTSDNNVNTRIGIGLMYTFPNDNISGLIQYQYTPLNNELINTMSEFSIGIRYNF